MRVFKFSSIHKKIIILAWPAVVGNILRTIVGIVDMMMVGRLGAVSAAAVGLGGQFLWFAMALMAAVGVGTTALIARFIGASKRKEAEKILIQSIELTIFLSIFLTFFGIAFSEDFLRILGASENVVLEGSIYIRIVFLSTIFNFIGFNSAAALRGAGDTKTPMFVDVVVNISNIILNYVLIFGKFGFPALGVKGAAIATAISFVLGGILILLVLFSGRFVLRLNLKDSFHPEIKTIRRILKIGIPASIQQIVMSGSMIVYVWIIVGFGTVSLAAHQIGLRIESLSYMPGFGFAVAATALVGQNLGAKKPGEAEMSGWESTKLCGIFMGFMGFLMILFPTLLAGMFIDDQEVIGLTAWYLRIVAISEPPLAVIFVLAGTLRGAGDTRFPLYISVFGLWVFRIPLAYFLGITCGYGAIGAWSAMTIDTFVRGFLYILRFKSGKWKEVEI